MVQVVWFKRDLRIDDHRALSQAAQEEGVVLPLYIVEPPIWHAPDQSDRQWEFVAECLTELRRDLSKCGAPLVIRTGSAVEVLDTIHRATPITRLWSHEETGNDLTFQRDKNVANWCRANGIPWQELRNHGVQRRIASRNGWAKEWDRFMSEPLSRPPALAPHGMEPGVIPTGKDLRLKPDPCALRQRGGRREAQETLSSFLMDRGLTYRRAMSSPVEGETTCSRLSPHLAWGTISMREVAQAAWSRQRDLKTGTFEHAKGWSGSMSSFAGRLHWHCHFIQKLEDQPNTEFRNFHPAYDGCRPREPDRARLDAWAKGETGLPFLDACMRYLRATGWLNFRMRAMVMATASYHLWLDWRAPGLVLARYFTDYEPGIHWSQVQMQSGTTGINTIRIYNPVKQGHDQDPTGVFTRRWLPELAAIPDKFLQEPWKADNAGSILDKTYPAPIVDHIEAARIARERMWAIRKTPEFRAEAGAIQARHGSRKSGIPNRGQRTKSQENRQLSLPFGDPQT